MKGLVCVLAFGLTVLFTLALCGCEKRSERPSTGISEEEYKQQREARIQARNEGIIEKNEKAWETAKKAKRAAREVANVSTYSDPKPVMAPTTVPNSQHYGDKRPSGVTTIGGLDYWSRNLPTKGGNSFIILEQFDNDCGPTSAEMVLYYYHKWFTQRDIWNKGDIHTVYAGTFPGELKRAFDGLGVPVLRLSMGSADYATNSWLSREIKKKSRQPSANYDPFPSLKRKIRQSKPCIILLQKGLEAYHWVVVVGYDNRDRFLIADPSGYFKWWEKDKLDKYWGFRKASGHGTKGDFYNATVRQFASPYTLVVPKNPPKSHFEPMWSQMQETEVRGTSRANIPNLNPLSDESGFRTEPWKHTFHFPQEYASPDYYIIACIKPSQLGTALGTAKGYVEGHLSTTKGEITVWGQIEYGNTTRGKLWIVVRVFRKGIKPWVAPRVIPG